MGRLAGELVDELVGRLVGYLKIRKFKIKFYSIESILLT